MAKDAIKEDPECKKIGLSMTNSLSSLQMRTKEIGGLHFKTSLVIFLSLFQLETLTQGSSKVDMKKVSESIH
jgi:hypothetical protein